MLKLILRIMSLLLPVCVAFLYISLRIGQQNPAALLAFISERNGQADVFLADSVSAINVGITERHSEDFIEWSVGGRYLRFAYFDMPDGSLMILDTEDWIISELELDEFAYAMWYDEQHLLVYSNLSDARRLLNVETGETQAYVESACLDCSEERDAFDVELSVIDGNLYVEIDKSRYPEGTQEPNPNLQPFTPDGQFFVFTSSLQGQNDIYLSHVNGGLARRLTNSPTPESGLQVSADGTKISFVSFDDGNAEIYVLELASGYRYNISRDPGRDESPSWQRLP